MEVLAGSSGFPYPQWKGPFYPAGMADDELLGFYSARLPTVEINNTLYRMPLAQPTTEAISRWP